MLILSPDHVKKKSLGVFKNINKIIIDKNRKFTFNKGFIDFNRRFKTMVQWFSIEELSKKSDNIYAFIKTLSIRAMELSHGATPLLLKPKSKNPVTVALEEAIADKIKIKTKVESFVPKLEETP
jgi:DNA-directed RNA polymerase subunit K/omega